MNKEKNILVNTRILQSPTTGVQRYLREILTRLPSSEIQTVFPPSYFSGYTANLWEQSVLPFRIGGNLLWSPGNTGPLYVKNQVVSIHDMSTLDHPEWFSPKFSMWYRFLLPKLAQVTKKIVTFSNFSRDRIVEVCRIDSKKVEVIYNAADTRFKRSSLEEIDKACSKLNIPTRRYILALGSLEPRKNLGRLVKAWGNIQQELPDDLYLVLSGARGKSTVFRDVSIDELPPRVFFTGYVLDDYLPALYSGAKAFIYPSLYEGFGLPPLEAISCGTPLIISNTTCLPEIFGDAGIYINPFDIEQISNVIQRVVTDSNLCMNLSARGLERAKQFSWDKSAELTWKVLHGVMCGS